jgi:CRISPR/Cas system endoribonuclease Cas6 (RAMP superfamily)
MLDQFRVIRYRFDLEAVDQLVLPHHQSSTFRGGFGHAFKKMVCYRPDWGACTPCERKNACPYGYIFETSAPSNEPSLSNVQDAPHPFVIAAPVTTARRVYQPGERLGFDIVLVGHAIVYLPYFLLAFQELGRRGIGNPAGRYALQRISAVHPLNDERELVYDGVDVRANGRDLSIGYAEVDEWAMRLPHDQLTLRFLTPMRVKHQSTYATRPDFAIIVRTLLRRIWALSVFHCNQPWEFNSRELINAAEQVETTHAAVKWADWDRYSARQGQRVPMGGFVGEATYQGDLAGFRGLLALGALVHIGKATVFGNGRYQVVGE